MKYDRDLMKILINRHFWHKNDNDILTLKSMYALTTTNEKIHNSTEKCQCFNSGYSHLVPLQKNPRQRPTVLCISYMSCTNFRAPLVQNWLINHIPVIIDYWVKIGNKHWRKTKECSLMRVYDIYACFNFTCGENVKTLFPHILRTMHTSDFNGNFTRLLH